MFPPHATNQRTGECVNWSNLAGLTFTTVSNTQKYNFLFELKKFHEANDLCRNRSICGIDPTIENFPFLGGSGQLTGSKLNAERDVGALLQFARVGGAGFNRHRFAGSGWRGSGRFRELHTLTYRWNCTVFWTCDWSLRKSFLNVRSIATKWLRNNRGHRIQARHAEIQSFTWKIQKFLHSNERRVNCWSISKHFPTIAVRNQREKTKMEKLVGFLDSLSQFRQGTVMAVAHPTTNAKIRNFSIFRLDYGGGKEEKGWNGEQPKVQRRRGLFTEKKKNEEWSQDTRRKELRWLAGVTGIDGNFPFFVPTEYLPIRRSGIVRQGRRNYLPYWIS